MNANLSDDPNKNNTSLLQCIELLAENYLKIEIFYSLTVSLMCLRL